MFGWMRWLGATLRAIIALFLMMIALFFLLCMDVFTVPLSLLICVLCGMGRKPMPCFRCYGLMLYPSWRAHPSFAFRNTVRKIHRARERRRTQNARKRFSVENPWEARFS